MTKAPKEETNSYQGWKYRTVDGIIEAVKSISPEGCYIIMSDDTWVSGEWHYIKATATFGFKDQKVMTTGLAREPLEELNKQGKLAKLPQQVTASSSTFARKIALCGLFAIDNSDAPDLDHQDQDDQYDKKTKDEIPKRQTVLDETPKSIGVNRAVELSGLIVAAKADVKKVLEAYNVPTLADLTFEQAAQACRKLKKKIAQTDAEFVPADYLKA